MTIPIEPEQQPRVPGVRYQQVTRYRTETTTINGESESREVPYVAWEPVPPRDLDGLIIRGVTGVAIGVTALAVTSTAASIGGLLDKMVWAPIAYGVACIFSLAWLACQGLEYVSRLEPKRAQKARVAGWLALLVSMSAVASFGVDKGEPVAGAVGAAVDLIAKSLWVLVLEHHAVPLSQGVAHWLRRRKERATATAAVAGHIRRLDQVEAYNRAVYGPTAATAEAVTTDVEPIALQGGPAVSGQVPLVSGQTMPPAGPAPVSAAPAPAAPPVPAPAVPAPAPEPVPVAPAPPVASTPPVGPAQLVDPAAAVQPLATTAPPANPAPQLHAVGGPFKSDTIRAEITANPAITTEELIARVTEVHGDEDGKNAASVPRTRRRIEQKAKKKRAS
ncbi:hypothetical protein ACGFR8_07770 [Streptomyces brevispora]|uniref:hypothetical protein n=1 Tax=Streptomyces brevispora TaxID=887462 RepID=UPI00371D0C03